jgi:hypothetical protein
MRSILEQAIPLSQGFLNQAEFSVLEVAEPSVDDTGGGRTGAGTEIRYFDQQCIQPLKRQFAKDPNAIDATPYEQGRYLGPTADDLKLLLSIHSGDGSAIIFFIRGASLGVFTNRFASVLPSLSPSGFPNACGVVRVSSSLHLLTRVEHMRASLALPPYLVVW